MWWGWRLWRLWRLWRSWREPDEKFNLTPAARLVCAQRVTDSQGLAELVVRLTAADGKGLRPWITSPSLSCTTPHWFGECLAFESMYVHTPHQHPTNGNPTLVADLKCRPPARKMMPSSSWAMAAQSTSDLQSHLVAEPMLTFGRPSCSAHAAGTEFSR